MLTEMALNVTNPPNNFHELHLYPNSVLYQGGHIKKRTTLRQWHKQASFHVMNTVSCVTSFCRWALSVFQVATPPDFLCQAHLSATPECHWIIKRRVHKLKETVCGVLLLFVLLLSLGKSCMSVLSFSKVLTFTRVGLQCQLFWPWRD